MVKRNNSNEVNKSLKVTLDCYIMLFNEYIWWTTWCLHVSLCLACAQTWRLSPLTSGPLDRPSKWSWNRLPLQLKGATASPLPPRRGMLPWKTFRRSWRQLRTEDEWVTPQLHQCLFSKLLFCENWIIYIRSDVNIRSCILDLKFILIYKNHHWFFFVIVVIGNFSFLSYWSGLPSRNWARQHLIFFTFDKSIWILSIPLTVLLLFPFCPQSQEAQVLKALAEKRDHERDVLIKAMEENSNFSKMAEEKLIMKMDHISKNREALLTAMLERLQEKVRISFSKE